MQAKRARGSGVGKALSAVLRGCEDRRCLSKMLMNCRGKAPLGYLSGE